MKSCFVFSLYSQAIAVLSTSAVADEPPNFTRVYCSQGDGGGWSAEETAPEIDTFETA